MVQKRWQDWINLILGLWTFVSPWVFGFAAGTSIAALAMWILGAAIAVFAAFAVYMHKAWEEVINILLGIGLITSPWVLSFTREVDADHERCGRGIARDGIRSLGDAHGDSSAEVVA